MIYFDTNALYYAAGKSSIQNIDIVMLNQIIRDEEVCVSSVTIFEMLNKYIKKPKDVREISSFLLENNVSIVNNDYMSSSFIKPEILKDITRHDLDDILYETKRVKMECEISFSKTIAIFVTIIYFKFYLYKQGATDNIDFNKFFYKFITETMIEYTEQYFKEEYISGYQERNCALYIKNSFYSFLSFQIEGLSKPILMIATAKSEEERKEIIKNLTDDDFFPRDIVNKNKKSVTSTKYIEKYIRKCGESLPQSFFVYLDRIFRDKAGIYKLSLSVAKDLTNGYAFEKNTISDRLILTQLKFDDSIITFDNKMIAFIKNQSLHKPEYLRSIELISKLKMSNNQGQTS